MLPQHILFEINFLKGGQGQHGHSFQSVGFFFYFPHQLFAESELRTVRFSFLSNLQSSERSINQAGQSGRDWLLWPVLPPAEPSCTAQRCWLRLQFWNFGKQLKKKKKFRLQFVTNVVWLVKPMQIQQQFLLYTIFARDSVGCGLAAVPLTHMLPPLKPIYCRMSIQLCAEGTHSMVISTYQSYWNVDAKPLD